MATYSGSDKRIKYLFENGGGGSSSLAGLDDVNISSPSDGDTLVYDATNQEWVNGQGGAVLAPFIYSLEEREIGVWTDGKPLYQKTLSLTSPSDASETIIYTGDSTIEIKKFEGYIVYSSGNIVEHLPLNISTAIWTMVGDTVNKLVQKISQLDYCGLTEYVTIQYTKTTDTAGSGTWTPSGANTVHYSTNEQIIGIWIDGKTLYEATIEVNNPTKQTAGNCYYYEANYSGHNIDYVQCIAKQCHDSHEQRWYDLPYHRIIDTESILYQGMKLDSTGQYSFSIFFRTSEQYSIDKIRYTIQYTKTSS